MAHNFRWFTWRQVPQQLKTYVYYVMGIKPMKKYCIILKRPQKKCVDINAPSYHHVQQTGLFTMTFKGGTCALLLIVACAALGKQQYPHTN